MHVTTFGVLAASEVQRADCLLCAAGRVEEPVESSNTAVTSSRPVGCCRLVALQMPDTAAGARWR